MMQVMPLSHQLRKLSSLGGDDDEMLIQEYSFSKLRYEVPLPTTPKERRKGVASRKVVLNGISGEVRPGEMLALVSDKGRRALWVRMRTGVSLTHCMSIIVQQDDGGTALRKLVSFGAYA